MAAIEIGYVVKAHGIKGELRVALHNPGSDTLQRVPEVVVGDVSYTVERARPVKDAVLLVLREVADRDHAERLRGQPVLVPRELIPMDDGELLLADLIGCEVVLEDGQPYGVVAAVEPGPQDRLIIEHGDIERMLPLVPEMVIDIDLDAARITVAPPPGMPEHPRTSKRISRHRPRR